MRTEVILPRVDMDMTAGTISRWHVPEGARVEKGQPLFEIETDKAAMEIDAPETGVIRGLAPTGVAVPVGSVVGWIAPAGEAFAAPDAAVPGAAASLAPVSGSPVAVASARPPSDVSDHDAREGAEAGDLRATPLARRFARERGIVLSQVRGTGPRGRIQARDIPETAAPFRFAGTAAAEAIVAEGRLRPASAPAVVSTGLGKLRNCWLRQGEGDPLVLLHGFGSELNGWRPLLADLPRGMPVFALDLPGHGGSALAGVRTIDDLAARAVETIASAGIGPCHLVGHSLGAAVAARAAEAAGFETRSLVLVSPAGLGPDIDGDFLAGFTRARGAESLRPWMHRLVQDESLITTALLRATVDARASGTVAADQQALAEALFPDGTQVFSIRSALERLAMPVRVVFGEADRIIPARHAAGLPGAVAVHRLPGVGHMPHVEARDLVARLIAQHVRSAG